MIGFLKVFGQGILYVVLSPFIIAFFALYIVYALIMFIVQSIKYLFMFFLGRDFKNGFSEDIEARKRMQDLAFNPATGSYQDKSKLENQQSAQPIINATNLQVNNINNPQGQNMNPYSPLNTNSEIKNLDNLNNNIESNDTKELPNNDGNNNGGNQ
jgi:hypothetical protein